jgi:hypothetical protein
MKLSRLVILLASAMAMVAVSMLGAAVAQAAEEVNKGPLWIVGSPARGLVAGETRAITSRTETGPILKGSVASVECEKATNSGFLLGGSPGTDYSKILFEKCNLVGAKNCVATGLKPIAATNPGEIRVDVLTDLAFANGSRISAVDIFAPEGETGNENLFSEFELLNKAGATTELCGAILNKIKIKVTASGTEIKIKNENRKAGQIAEIGHLVEGKFVLSTPGLTAAIGLLRFGNEEKPVKTAELYNSTKKEYEKISAELTAGEALGEVFEEASTEIEIPTLELFGWNY